MDILSTRLQNQHLLGEKLSTSHDVVSSLGAVQAQDFQAAKWALGMRIKNSSDQEVEKAFSDGEILRTHVLRPTWHFVSPNDIFWMLKLTAPRVKMLMSHYNRKLELDDRLFIKTNSIIESALAENGFLTRKDLKERLLNEGIKTDVQRLAHIVMWAELDGIICSGPRIGKQFTYALLRKRVKKTENLEKPEALAKLSLRYFSSHGPAQVKDFSWWSGLSLKEANEGLDLIKDKLVNETINSKIYWFAPRGKKVADILNCAFLLSVYDEYTISYKDRTELSSVKDIEKILPMGSLFNSVIIIDGKVSGIWKRKIFKDRVEISLEPFIKMNKKDSEKIEKACSLYAKFLGMELKIT